MSILTQYRERLHLKDIEKEKQQINKKTEKGFTGLNAVGILIDATNPAIVENALLFVEKLRKEAGNIHLLGYADVKELTQSFSFDCFCKKDLDWIWRPKKVLINRFKQQKLDLLINLCQTDCFPLEYLAVAAKANYKIGALTDYPNNYDLMLDTKNFDSYLKQVNFFLAKFSN